MKKLMITVLAVFMAAAPSFAAVYDNASIIFPLLSLGVGGRALGMGDAFTAVADDASSVYWNAAGLSSVKTVQIGMTYDNWISDSLFGQIQFAMPLPAGAIGADIIYMNSGALMGRTDSGVETESFTLFNIGASLGYGIEVNENISVGAAVKIISLSSGTLSSTGFAADLGGMFKTGIFSAGLNVQNLGTSTGNYSLPINVKVGVAAAVMKEKQHDLLFALDTQYVLKDAVSLGGGVEYTYDKTLTARLGYKTAFGTSNLEGVKGICGGIGIKYQNFTFDYALVPYGDLGLTQKATLSYSFGSAAKKAPMADVKETSPVKEAAVKTTTKKAPAAVKKAAKKTVKKASKPQEKRSALYNEAYALEKSGEVDKAVAKYREALKANAKIADGWKRLGTLYLKKNNKAEAIKCYDEYMKLVPLDAETGEWLKAYKVSK